MLVRTAINNPTTSPVDEEVAEKRLIIRLMTDDHPQDTTYKLVNSVTRKKIKQKKKFTRLNSLYTKTIDLPMGTCFDFNIKDKNKDGLSGRGQTGWYAIIVDDIVLKNATEFIGKKDTFSHCITNNADGMVESRDQLPVKCADKTGKFKVVGKKKKKTCEKIAKVNKICNYIPGNYGGQKLANTCPVACGLCEIEASGSTKTERSGTRR